MAPQISWKADLRQWLQTDRDISRKLGDDIVSFFGLAFEHTLCPHKAWFGVHKNAVSLVVGGIYLAAVERSGRDQGVWVLVDETAPPIDGISYRPVKSARRSNPPLLWAHSETLAPVPSVVEQTRLWDSFRAASEIVLDLPIAKDRDTLQLRRKKTRLTEVFFPDHFGSNEDRLARAVRLSIRDSDAERRSRLATAAATPTRFETTTTAFSRNPDVVAEVLLRANGYCEDCGALAPFLRRTDNTPYLEVHHEKPLSDGGLDTVENAVALCPNCHRKAHFG